MQFFGTNLPPTGSYFQSKTDKIDTTIEFCIFELVFLSNLTLNNFEFLDQTCPRKILMVKNRKIEHHHFIPHIQVSLGTKFQLKLTILIFIDQIYRLKQKKWTPHIFYIILHIQISLVRNFSSNWQFYFLDQICTKRCFRSKTEKVNIIIEFRILKSVSWYQISALTDNFEFFGQICPKKVFLV